MFIIIFNKYIKISFINMLKIDSQAILGHFFNHLNSYLILRERIISQLDEIILILRESKKSDEKSDFQNKFLIKIAEIIEIKKELEKKSQASEKKDNKGLKNGNVDKKDDIKEENKSYDNIKD